MAARKTEIEFFKKMGVSIKVHKSKAFGNKVVTTRWIDTNKGDDKNRDHRSRLVGRELKTDNRLDLFAATPPLEMVKMLVSICARNQSRADPMRMATIDIKRAYFYAPVEREVFIQIPEEDKSPGDEDKVAQLRLSLYGTRDAAQNWARRYSKHLMSLGFTQGRASPCNFHHASPEVYITCHGTTSSWRAQRAS